ncbi:aminoacyltransferase [Enterococcus rivorum]|uniref:Methicillin resistance factor FemA n=1 Tax=Enterococcus rivorum TaxID=762845 RepID=A0A1E5KZ93_9ENTE|nr:aminoacyltransferase [Enterococcus rivorum]MBP2099438.1 serine/alanine adding enzyme [Enterococcus rivorum]OEH83180.1 methicillin resistance factor FemA [Enterococcus rivorum]
MYKFEIGIAAEEHDAFVANHALCNLLQSSSWAKVKDNWDSEIIGVYQAGKLVASSLVLIRLLPFKLTMLYTPRGPVLDYNDASLVAFFMKELKHYAKKKRALFVKMDPTVHYRDFQLGEKVDLNPCAEDAVNSIIKAGAQHQGLAMEMSATIQPRFQANIYKEDFSHEQLSKSTKKMINQAKKRGVTIRIGREKLIPEFFKMIELTTERQKISLRNKDYFEKLLSIYPNNSFIMLAEVNLKERFAETKQRYEKNKENLQNLKENQVKKKHNLEELDASLSRELKELQQNIAISGEKAVVAGTLSITFGTTSEILYAGMDESYKRYMPAYFVWFETIQECFSRGCLSCNMGGVEGNLNDGLIKFKANFNPTINEFIGEFDLPVNHLLFGLSKFAYKLKKEVF